MIFITGDIHGEVDIRKLSSKNFSLHSELTRDDYLIICGDFGLRWDNSKEEKYWLRWLEQKPWTTLWIDGNHENFDMLREYEVQQWNGGNVQKITDNIIHLCRGSVFELCGKKIFAFGGAESHDKEHRELGRTLWNEELPSEEEMEYGRQVLEKHDWKVDIVVTHSLPQSIQAKIFENDNFGENCLTKYFDELDSKLDYKLWFSGHYHKTAQYSERYNLIYNSIVKLNDDGFEYVYISDSDLKCV